MSKQLAIVIPAYKGRFLRQALESIARQTDKRFTVYVGDDAGPDNIRKICDEFAQRLDLIYTGFANNLGRDSLVAQWNRCVELSSEPWIWLFCDDDVMEPECVESFYKTIDREKDQFRVLRFNTLTIDENGEILFTNPSHPLTETGVQFIYHRLRYERLSYVSEYIFSRTSFLENRGFVDFPLAYCSDDASWLVFSRDKAILTIQGANVHWRQSSYNITPSGAKFQTERIEATSRFITWLDDYIKINETGDQYVTEDMLKELAKNWFLRQVRGVAPLSFSSFARSAGLIHSITQRSWLRSYTFLANCNLKFYLQRFREANRKD